MKTYYFFKDITDAVIHAHNSGYIQIKYKDGLFDLLEFAKRLEYKLKRNKHKLIWHRYMILGYKLCYEIHFKNKKGGIDKITADCTLIK